MGLDVNTEKKEGTVRNGFTVTERLYKDKDGNVVKAGDESAVSLYKSPGAVIPMEEAEELGLTKQAEKPADKKRAPARNKKATKQAEKPAEDAGDSED